MRNNCGSNTSSGSSKSSKSICNGSRDEHGREVDGIMNREIRFREKDYSATT